MNNKDLNNTSYTSRMTKRKVENELKEKQIEKERELEQRRKELQKVLFDKKEKTKKPIITNIFLSLVFVITFALFIFLILDSSNHIDQIYRIINSLLLLFIIIGLLLSFKNLLYKNKTIQMNITAFLILITLMFNGLYITNIIKLPQQSHIINFENTSLTQAIEWTDKNNIKNNETFEYSDNIKKYNIINQSEKEGTLTKNIKSVDFIVSNGPDYNKEVILSDMTGQNVNDVLKFINNNHLKNVQINFEENVETDKNYVIKQSSTGKIKRSDAIIFTVSLGEKSKLNAIKLKKLTNESLLNASVYLGQNGIIYELKYEFSNKIEKGNVISTNIKKGTSLKADDKIVLTISKGKQIKVPDFKNKSLSYITKWMIYNNVQINYLEEYSDIKQGYAIKSNYNKGDIIEEETTIDITFSKGILKMKSFKNISEFKSWADSNNIKYEIKEEFNDLDKDTIIKTSIKDGEKIKQDDTIIVYVSKGQAVTVPDFNGKTKANIQKECNSLGITCSFTSQYSSKVTNDTMISQSIKAGEKISKNDTLSIVIATNKKENTTNKSTSSNSSSSSNNTSSNSSNTTSNCKDSSSAIYITPDLISNDPSDTCQKITNKFGDYLSCQQVESDSGKKGMVINASEINGKIINSCNKLVVKVRKN